MYFQSDDQSNDPPTKTKNGSGLGNVVYLLLFYQLHHLLWKI